MDLTDRVRSTCAQVIRHAEHVALDRDRLHELAATFNEALPPVIAATVEFSEERAIRVLAGDAINFGSGYHDIIRKEPGLSGARTMQLRLDRYLDATGPLSWRRLRAITSEDCSQIFGQELDGGASTELMNRFASALSDLGSFVAEAGGSARAVLEHCEHSAVRLAEMLTVMPYYRDQERYAGMTVSFYKRAQITPADLYRNGLWSFADLPRLTAFADNLVPHVLRVDGALILHPDLAASIDRRERLEPGSKPEVELRAAAVVAVDQIVASIDQPDVWALHVDQWLWERGGGARYKAVPRPRARSVFY
ncbi:MAG: hypothetical protein HKN03_05420 [Acidimicrobiales bacterium]|nr:hypothetical protein [Acidimicrobiales bacterium]